MPFLHRVCFQIKIPLNSACCFSLLFSLFFFLHFQLVCSIHTINSTICALESFEYSFQPFIILHNILFKPRKKHLRLLFFLHFPSLFASSSLFHLLLILLKLITRTKSHLSFTFNQGLLIKDNLNAA